jgi:PST family polysaccharide transporter
MRSRSILTENILALSIVQMLNYAAPLITVPYLVGVLGPFYFGMLSFAQNIIGYFDFATDYGFNFTATRAIAVCRQDSVAVSRIFWVTLSAKCLLMCANALPFSLLVALVPRLHASAGLFAVNFLYVLGTTFFPLWLFQGLERLKLAAVFIGVARLLTIPALFIFVRTSDDYVAAGAIQASVELVAAIFALPYLISGVRLVWQKPLLSEIAASLKQGWPLFLCGSAFLVSTSNTTAILGFAASQAQVGYFSAADKLIKAAAAALHPIGQALYPHLAGLKMRSKESALHLIRKGLVATGALSLLVSIATFALARPICTLVLGHSFTESVAVLKWLSPLPFLLGLINILGTQTMLVFGMDRKFTKIVVSNVIFTLPLSVVASAEFGAVGAAAASVAFATFLVVAMAGALQAQGLPIWRNLLRKRACGEGPLPWKQGEELR